MASRDVSLAVFVMLIWGCNFVVIDAGLADVPPLLFLAARFAVVLLALPFVARPTAPLARVLLVGVLMSLGQFGLLYSAMAAGLPPGMASLVLQAQAIFTVAVAVLVLRERPVAIAIAGLVVGMVGLLVVGAGRGESVPLLGVVLCLGGALSWAVGNVLVRYLGITGGLGVTVWSALAVPLPLLALAAALDGPGAVISGIASFSPAAIASTLYTAVGASLIGYGLWNSLLAKYPASSVGPFTLLVPPIGIAAAWAFRDERPTIAVLGGGALLVLGVAMVSVGPRAASALRHRKVRSDSVTVPAPR